MNWKRRFSKVLGSWITGYGGGIASIFTISAYQSWDINFVTLFLIPAISGLIVALPQLGKVFNEYGNMGKNST